MAERTEKTRYVTAPFIACFPNVFEPRLQKPRKGETPNPNAKPQYGVTALWFDPPNLPPPDAELHRAMMKALSAEAMSAFGKKWSDLNPLHYKTGVRKNESREEPFAGDRVKPGALFANLTSQYMPDIVDHKGNPISKAEGNTHLIYPGCLMRASVNPYSFKGDDNKGVSLGLNNLILLSGNLKAWPRLDNRQGAADEFSETDDSAWLGDEDEPDARYDTGEDDGGY